MMLNGPARPVDPSEVDRLRDIFTGMLSATASFTDGMTAVLADVQDRYVLVPREEYEETRKAFRDMASQFQEQGYPGRACLRTGWIDAEVVQKWRDNVPKYVP